MKNNNIVILGAGGMLGQEIFHLLETSFNVHSYTRNDIDVTNERQLQDVITENQPAWIINCAAHTKVDLCESEPELAMKINVYAVETLAAVAKKTGSRIIHFSTDYVFEGQNPAGYDENSIKQPINVYGSSKSFGEDALHRIYPEGSYIIRTAWLYGKYGKNFVTTMLDLASKQDILKIVNDQVGSPTYTLDVARSALHLIEENRQAGIYHAVNSGQASWYEFAQEIFRLNERKTGIKQPTLIPIKSSELDRPATRPAYSILQNTKLPPLRPWQEALHYFLNHDL